MKFNIAPLAETELDPSNQWSRKSFWCHCKKIQPWNHLDTSTTGACAIDAVGVPYPDETHEICIKQMLFYLEHGTSKIR
jgi:3-isopropylmalate dehydrogenase